jgi:hypothetical protein
MRNEFRPEANFCFKQIFEAKCSQYFVTELNIAKPNLKVHCPLPTVIAHCPLPLSTAHCLLSTLFQRCENFKDGGKEKNPCMYALFEK